MAGFDNTVVGTDNVGLIIEPVIESTALTSFCTVLQDVKAREKVASLKRNVMEGIRVTIKNHPFRWWLWRWCSCIIFANIGIYMAPSRV